MINRIKNKFMKAIYAKDIKAMVKQFDLNEAESDRAILTPISLASLAPTIATAILFFKQSKSPRT